MHSQLLVRARLYTGPVFNCRRAYMTFLTALSQSFVGLNFSEVCAISLTHSLAISGTDCH